MINGDDPWDFSETVPLKDLFEEQNSFVYIPQKEEIGWDSSANNPCILNDAWFLNIKDIVEKETEPTCDCKKDKK